MRQKLDKKKKIILTAIASWGILLIGSGSIMQLMIKPVKIEKNLDIKVMQRKVEKTKTNEIKLNDMSLEINQPLSLNIRDYLKNPDDIETKIINQLKLDTSMVNANEAGIYTYTISYNKKKYNGTFKITEKPLPTIETMTLRTLSLEIGSTLSTNISTYVTEVLPEEAKANIKLDLSNVNTKVNGIYQYSVTYNGKLYTGMITIYEPQQKIETKKEETVENKDNEVKEPQENNSSTVTATLEEKK